MKVIMSTLNLNGAINVFQNRYAKNTKPVQMSKSAFYTSRTQILQQKCRFCFTSENKGANHIFMLIAENNRSNLAYNYARAH